MIRKILRCLNEAKYGPLPEKVKPKQENTGLKHAQTATVVEFNNSKETQWDDMFNIGDVRQLNKYVFAQCNQALNDKISIIFDGIRGGYTYQQKLRCGYKKVLCELIQQNEEN